ncbi:MAG: PL29 family lyase N-terminal domain-containing protein [Fermentimonas sp.]
MTNRLSVVSYKELADMSGYELTMSDGSKITLKHGTDGTDGKDGKDGADGKDGVNGVTPEISVKLHDDGLLYWTINGEFLFDADGNMIPAQGKDGKDGNDGNDGSDGADGTPGKDGKDGADGAQGAQGADGKDGITPQLRINADLYWEMSLDGGTTWQLLMDADNNPIKAQGPQGSQGPEGQPGAEGEQGPQGPQGPTGEKGAPGQDGDANLTITETDNAITIVYKGVTFTIPKGPLPLPTMTLITKKSVNGTIILFIDAAPADQAAMWIDLNNNGIMDTGENDILFGNFKNYTFTAQTVTIHGKATLLGCGDNQLVALDVSKNTALQTLTCVGNLLTSLDVTQNTELKTLDCDGNSLTVLDVTKNIALEMLRCSENSLTVLDVTQNTALETFSCYSNQLTALNVANNPKLSVLNCHTNQLTALDVTNNIELEKLYCYGNQIKQVEMEVLVNSLVNRTGKDPAGEFYVHNSNAPTNVITKEQVATATEKNWKVFDINGNDYEGVSAFSMTLTTNKGVGGTLSLVIDAAAGDQTGVWIDLNDNKVKDADEGDIAFNASKNYTFTTQTVTIYGKVNRLVCSGNNLTALDVTRNAELKNLDCSMNQLTTLDVSKNTVLQYLYCYANQLIALNVTNNTELEHLYCYGNQIKDARMETLVNSLVDRTSTTEGEFRVHSSVNPTNVISKEQIAKAKEKNWKVTDQNGSDYEGIDIFSMTLTTSKSVGATINLVLYAHPDDRDEVWIDFNNNGIKDPGDDDVQFEISKHYTLKAQTFTIYGKVTMFGCPDNEITSLDVTKNTLLEGLYCNNNLLTSLDLNKNSELKRLECYSNQIKKAAMDNLVNSMTDRMGREAGKYKMGWGGNEFDDFHTNILTSKNWNPL